MKRFNSHKTNVLLLKDDVGRPKPNTRKIPQGQDFYFGKAEYRDPEDAGQVTSKWHYSHESKLER